MSTDVDRAVDADEKVLKFETNASVDEGMVEIEEEEPTPEEIAEAAVAADEDGVVQE